MKLGALNVFEVDFRIETPAVVTSECMLAPLCSVWLLGVRCTVIEMP